MEHPAARPVLSGSSWHRRYRGGGAAACTADLRVSLAAAAQRALDEQGLDEQGQDEQDAGQLAALTYDKSADIIRPVTAGVVGTRPIDWQNRPTFQQVVRLRS